MLRYEDRVCRAEGCGRTKCNHCEYCRETGHKVHDCPKAPPCRACDSKGHKTEHCTRLTTTKPVKSRGVPPRPSLSSQQKEGTIIYNTRITPPPHNSPEWFKIPEEIRESIVIQEDSLFPNLTALCSTIFAELLADRLPGSLSLYKDSIRNWNRQTNLNDYCVSFISPEIRQLQGRYVTRNRLDSIKDSQARDHEEWDETSMGYLDYVTDTRNVKYLRTYIGQCLKARRRLFSQHGQSILRGDKSSLHYFIIWMGNGKRSASFIRLWEFPRRTGDSDKPFDIFLRNILETLLCRAFSAHHGSLRTWDKKSGLASGFGLNLMTPLVQGYAASDFIIAASVSQLATSPDPQIRHWQSFRAAAKTEDANKLTPNSEMGRSLPVYRDQLKAAIGQASMDMLSGTFALDALTDIDIAPPDPPLSYTGNPCARIGVLLDYSIVSAAATESSFRLDNRDGDIPWQLRGAGFDMSNVLVWTHNFLPFTTLGESRTLDSPNFTPGDGSHSVLIQASHVRVILVCGPRAEEAIRRDFQNLEKSKLELRYDFTLYFDGGDGGNCPPRIFIKCPEMPSSTRAVPYHHNSKIGEALRFAAKMTGTEGVRSAFLETSGVVSFILSRIRAERLGKVKPMTVDAIDEGVKFWLFNRGFTGLGDIVELEKLSGTLSRGLLVVLHGRYKLARDGKIPYSSRWHLKIKKTVRVHEPFDPETYLLARAFYAKLAAATDNEVVKVCTPTSTYAVAEGQHTSDENPSSVPDDMIPEEPTMDDLVTTVDPDIISSITNGDNYPLANVFKAKRRNRMRRTGIHSGVSDWKKEKDRWRTTAYEYILPEHTLYKERRVSIGHCRISIDRNLKVKDNRIYIWIEIQPPGIRHPNCYATQALYNDPAARLAFLTVYVDASTGQEVREHAFFSTYGAVCRANTFVDLICDGKSSVEIAFTPRRFLDVAQVRRIPDLAQRTDLKGGFTDDLLGLDRTGGEGENEDEGEGENEDEMEIE